VYVPMYPLNKVCCITFPRSGHHLLVNCLLKYFSRDINYPATEGHLTFKQCRQVLHAGDFHYCEYYNHCKSIPCTDPTVNFQKYHDIHMGFEFDRAKKFVIQYRHPIETIVSYYNFLILTSKELGMCIEDNEKNWSNFIYTDKPYSYLFSSLTSSVIYEIKRNVTHLLYRMGIFFPNQLLRDWKRFVKKWVINSNSDNSIFVYYGDLVNKPVDTLKEVISFMNPTRPIDEVLLEKIAQIVYKKNSVQSFKYYHVNVFKKMEHFVVEEMKILGIKSIFSLNRDRHLSHS